MEGLAAVALIVSMVFIMPCLLCCLSCAVQVCEDALRRYRVCNA